MCGIAGIFNYRDHQPINRDQLTRMANSMVHRGPDDEGFYVSGPLGLAHRRLSIVDVKGGHQPMSNEDDSVWVVFNGEIYNHRELRPVLESRGHRFKTNCDTEIILHAYEEYGENFVNSLNGMFAFALWDQKTGTLLLGRDRLGIKPLYYSFYENGLIFGSEVKALLSVSSLSPSLDLESLDCFLSLSYVPSPWTLFRGIVKLPPAHVMKVTQGNCEVRSYWDFTFHPKWTASEGELEEQFRQILTDTVESHLMSEVPLGVFLSGGLDSSFIVSCMTQSLKVPCKTFCIGYEDGSDESELREAKLVADKFGTQHYEYRMGHVEFVNEMPKILRFLEEPVASPAIIPLYYLAKAAREEVTVVLSGEGADELLGGYSLYQRMLLAERLYSIRLLKPALGLLQIILGEKFERFNGNVPFEERYQGISSAFGNREKAQAIPSPFNTGRLKTTQSLFHNRTKKENLLDRMLYFDSKVWLVDDLLLKADKMTMASSLELRVPFLDQNVVEFCARLPVDLKLKKDVSKVLLRRILSGSLPSSLLNRHKKGFPVPIARWFQSGLRKHIHEVILDRESLSQHIFSRPFLESLVASGSSAVEATARKLWTLYQLEQWKAAFGVRL